MSPVPAGDLFGEPDAHDPGGKVRLKIAAGMTADAVFSSCGQYRHWLSRRWDGGAYALWIGMNPSTATAHIDDPTIRREIEFTRRMGLGRYIKTNVMDYRATNPRDLIRIAEPCSKRNLEEILKLAEGAGRVILAYGSIDTRLKHYAHAVETMLGEIHLELWCLDTNKDGSPKHPLYVRGDTPIVRYVSNTVPWKRKVSV